MSGTDKFTHVITSAPNAHGLTIKMQLAFHAWNPNGIIAEKHFWDRKVTDAVNAKQCASGAIVAYGSLNSYSEDRLSELHNLPTRSLRQRALDYAIDRIRSDIERTKRFLAELGTDTGAAA